MVLRAIEKTSGEHFACKVMDAEKAYLNGSEIESLLNEARVLRDLDMPYIIKCKDVFFSQGKIHIIMEVVDGGDLFDRIAKKHKSGYPEDKARELMSQGGGGGGVFYLSFSLCFIIVTALPSKTYSLQVVEAVRFLHANNVIHRDLKPENILLKTMESDVDIKLTDFGLAKSNAQSAKTFCGTPQYFAPEVQSKRQTETHHF